MHLLVYPIKKKRELRMILITGISGFIGQHVASIFVKNGYDVVGVDIKPKPDNSELINCKHYQLDINSLDFENVFKENSIEFIVHLAANSSVPYSVNNPLEDAEVNYLGSIRTVSLAKKYGVKRFIAASTAALYAHPRYLPVKETHPPNCLSPYAITKQSMEYYIVLSGINYTILRFSNVYGPGQNKKGEAGVISLFIDAMKANEEVKVFGDGEQIRDFIYVGDIARAIFEVAQSENCVNKIMNISANKATTINELFYKLKELLNYEKSPVYLPEREGDIKASILDNTLAKETFGFEPTVDIETGLSETLNLKERVCNDRI